MSVPPFQGYYPSFADLRGRQRAFYNGMALRIAKGQYVDVEGNIGYVFIYLYGLIRRWVDSDLVALSDHLIRVGELYRHEDKIRWYCDLWAYDCLFGQGRLDEYLDKTEGLDIGKYFASDRLNAQRWTGRPASSLDVLAASNQYRWTKFVKENKGFHREHVIALLEEFSGRNGAVADLGNSPPSIIETPQVSTRAGRTSA